MQVLLGHSYDVAIDMWSLGCMAAELFLGLPLFPGASEHDLLLRITETLGDLCSDISGQAIFEAVFALQYLFIVVACPLISMPMIQNFMAGRYA